MARTPKPKRKSKVPIEQAADLEREKPAPVRRSGVVLVTGSSGFIGSAIIDRLSKDLDVVGLDAKPPRGRSPADFIQLDLTSDESVRAALDRVRERHGSEIVSVIHLAAYFDFAGEPSPLYEQVTVRGTERLLRELKHFHVEQFVFSSSMLVYAPCEPGQRIDERWPLDPKWDYPRSKVETERVLEAQHGAIPLVVLRIAGVYDDRCHSIPIAHQIQRIFERKLTSHVYPGDTTRGQSFLHLDDLVEALALLVSRRGELEPVTTLNLGEPDTPSYEELQRSLGLLLHGEEWATRQIPKPLAKAGAWLEDKLPGEEPFIKPWMIDLADDHYELDVARARAVLGWEPRRRLGATLPRMVEALRSDPVGWYRENKLEVPESLEKQVERRPEEQPHAP